MRLTVPLVVLIATLLAGCASSQTQDPGLEPAAPGQGTEVGTDGAEETSPASAVAWNLTTCRHVIWWPTVQPVPLQDRVPEGYTVRAGNGGVGLLGPLGIEAFSCASGSGLNETVPDLAYGSIFIAVRAPPEQGCDNLGGACYVKTDVLVPDAPRRDWLAARGLPVRDGGVDVPALAAGPATATLELEDIGTFTATYAFDGNTAASAGVPFREFTVATGGVAVWSAETLDAAQANIVGTWTASSGSWVAQVFGATQGTAYITVGTWSFTNATIALP